MKSLTKIRLINWHYFENETISIKGNTLMTGENASGKSTILDAISFVLTAGDQNFNLAAIEKGKRDLRSYVKCKLGSLDQEYLRDYDQTGHICLEFYSEKQEKFFCLGAVIDVVGNAIPPKVIFYIVDSEMKDDFFINDKNEVKNTAEFKKTNLTDKIYSTRKEAKSAFRSKMGGVSEKYFTLLPKALAFKPITDVKDYIYQHLLEEKTINVQNIQESIRSYKEFENILKITKAKISDLEKISENYFAIKDIKDNEDFYNYLLSTLKRSENSYKIEQKSKAIEKIEREKNEISESVKNIMMEIDSLDEKSKMLYSSLSKDSNFASNEIYDRDINNISDDLKLATEKKKEYERRTLQFKDIVDSLEPIDKDLNKTLKKINFNVNNEEECKTLIEKIIECADAVDKKKEELIKNKTELELQKNQVLEKIQSVYSSLSTLSKNDIPYRPEIIELRRQMELHLKNLYKEDIKVHILAEILEVKDPSWQDTVEDFLGNQRFTLIVEPKYYDDCLDCYNEFKSKKIFGINLLNTKKIQDFTSYEKNSLASIIETENKDARLYINYFCGQLIMVDDVRELDKYNQSITKSGMLYRGFVTRYLNPNTEKPFIGSGARGEQSKKFTLEGEILKQEFHEVSEKIKKISDTQEIISKLDLDYIGELLSYVKSSYSLTERLEELKKKKSTLSVSGVNELRVEYENIKEEIRLKGQKKDSLQIEIGIKRQAIEQINSDIISLTNENKQIDLDLADIENNHLDYRKRTDDLFVEERNTGRSSKDIEEKYTKEINDLMQSVKSLENGLVLSQVSYISTYNRPFSTGYSHVDEYLEELDKLVKSELVKYETKVRESREEAEKLFKEDFLSKLRSYILEAQDEMTKINETLDKIVFGNDKYQFVFPKSKEFSAIYDMIVNEIGSDINKSVFNEEFEKKYNQELDELFNNLSQDEEGSSGNLNKYTDYRTYMDYDIKIISNDDIFYFSQISRVRSGAETQIPFYVAILASFVRLFDKAEKNGLDDSIGLIIFDEVFDKMDTTRTDAMMDFISKLNVQILFACPPQKMEALSKKTSTTIAVIRNDKVAGTFVATEK